LPFEEFVPRGRHAVARKLLQPSLSDRVLDVGCGSGYFERHYLIGKVERVRAVDVNAAAIAYAQQRGGREHFIVAPAENLPFEDASFDKVLCLDTLEHVEDARAAISEIHRVLKTDGLLVLSVPNDFLNFLDRRKDHRESHFSEQEMRELLGTAFRIEQMWKTALLPPLITRFLRIAGKLHIRRAMRKLTGPIVDIDYHFNLGFGFALIVSARKA
jgi:ubiquinone/menaquinone biosynthesis C-methylase UbiE